jgi:imidazolonepropionase
VRGGGLAPAEGIPAATLHGAEVLGLHDRGQVSPGQRADLLLLRHEDERALAHEFADHPIDVLIASGQVVSP